MQQEQPTREFTFGEQLVGLNFNPSNDPRVDRVKQVCAELADLIKSEMTPSASTLKKMLMEQAIAEILDAQMYAVKVLTFKN